MDEEQAPERNERLTAALAEAGKALGLAVEREYPVPGGRIDVVWLWEGPERFAVKLPLVLLGHGAHLSKDDEVMQMLPAMLAGLPSRSGRNGCIEPPVMALMKPK